MVTNGVLEVWVFCEDTVAVEVAMEEPRVVPSEEVLGSGMRVDTEALVPAPVLEVAWPVLGLVMGGPGVVSKGLVGSSVT